MKEQKIDFKEMNRDNNQGEIVIYQTDDGDTKIDVRFVDETVWLTQAQLCELYQTSKSNVSEHIKNIFEEGELEENSVERLKNLGGGNYWNELLDRIRDIRSSEKVMYRQVLARVDRKKGYLTDT